MAIRKAVSQRVRPEVQTSRRAPVTQKRPRCSTKPSKAPSNRPEAWEKKTDMSIPELGDVMDVAGVGRISQE